MRDEENEHRCSLDKGLLTSSLEIELPFVYELFGNRVKVVMIMVGCVSSNLKEANAEWESVSVVTCRSLVPYLKDPKTVFVISSDFCHWGENFEFMPYDKTKGEIWQSTQAMDLEGAGFIERNDAEVVRGLFV